MIRAAEKLWTLFLYPLERFFFGAGCFAAHPSEILFHRALRAFHGTGGRRRTRFLSIAIINKASCL